MAKRYLYKGQKYHSAYQLRQAIYEQGLLPFESSPNRLRFRADYRPYDDCNEHQVKPEIARDRDVNMCDNLPRG